MARKKLEHFAQMRGWPNVFEPDADTKSFWKGPIILELACGGGDYALALAQRFPNCNVVGVDIKGSRIWHGAGKAMGLGLKNLFFLRTRIEDICDYFEKSSVDEIWITFPDPHPREGKIKKRLTSRRFLELYKQILKDGGSIHLKTDVGYFYEYTKESVKDFGGKIIRDVPDVYALNDELLHVQTKYEKMHLADGKTIKYLQFTI